MNTLKLQFVLGFFILLSFASLIHSQRSEGRRLRQTLPEKCDRYGRCRPEEGYIEEAEHGGNYKSDKDRPTELTRDDWPVRPIEDTKPLKPSDDKVLKDEERPGDRDAGYGRGTSTKPLVDSDSLKPSGGGRPNAGGGGYGGGSYMPKPVDTDDLKPYVGGRPTGGGGYNPKPTLHRDDEYGVERPVRGGHSGGGSGGGYRPKPDVNRDDDLSPAQPPRGGYNRRVIGNDEYRPKPGRGDYDDKYIEDKDTNRGRPGVYGGRGEKSRDKDDYNIKPARGGYPNDDNKPIREDHGGYNKPKDEDYNDYNDGRPGGYDDDDYDGGSKPIAVKDEKGCICVPYYQCKDGHIVVDGAGIIDARKRPDPDDLTLDAAHKPSCGPIHVCCNTPETSTVKPYEHRCGVRNPSGINSRILSPSNKGEADFGEWPWQAAVLKEEGKVNIFQCGGVLIDKYHVLTVAHCVFHLYQYNEYPLKVRLGEWDTQTTTEFLAHEDYKVSKIIIHPDFKNSSLWNDIAILKLQDPVLFAPHIDTVCLPEYDEIFAGQNCVVTGWGKDAYKGGTFSNVMKEVVLQVTDNYKCEEMLRKTRLGRFFQLHEGFMCAGGEYGLDSCKGDGGGPLVCYRKNKSHALVGIVSWGIDCGQPGVPGVYVKIQKYLDWISKSTGVSLQEYWPKK